MPWNLLFCTFGSEKYFAGKRKMAETIFKAQPSFSPYFDFTLERIYECGDKLMHSKKEAKFLLKMNLYLYLWKKDCKHMKLKIINFGPIKEADIDFWDLTFLIGPQASGKSLSLELLKLILDKQHIISTFRNYNYILTLVSR